MLLVWLHSLRNISRKVELDEIYVGKKFHANHMNCILSNQFLLCVASKLEKENWLLNQSKLINSIGFSIGNLPTISLMEGLWLVYIINANFSARQCLVENLNLKVNGIWLLN